VTSPKWHILSYPWLGSWCQSHIPTSVQQTVCTDSLQALSQSLSTRPYSIPILFSHGQYDFLQGDELQAWQSSPASGISSCQIHFWTMYLHRYPAFLPSLGTVLGHLYLQRTLIIRSWLLLSSLVSTFSFFSLLSGFAFDVWLFLHFDG